MILKWLDDDVDKNGIAAKVENGILAGDQYSTGAQTFVLNFSDNDEPEITGILVIANPTPKPSSAGERTTSAWYSLDGRKLSGKSTHKGVYI